MAEETTAPNQAEVPAGEAPAAPGKRSIFGKIKILLFVAAVIAAECFVANLYVPSASETAALAGAALGAKPKPSTPAEPDAQKEKQAEPPEQVEVDLGQFTVTAFQPTSNSTLRIDFRLYGTVGAKDDKEFLKLKEENLHRFRDQVIISVRSAEISDLTDAGLGLIKRKILEKTNRLFGKPLLRTVIFSDFSLVEQ